mmetsp:Transcript_8239/g.14105  ORF Transcript_8239/g.14105 Transcript_8239/m.14105 type:complete len:570 (-) Transcript_8239:494-2203(-)|eukprot:CAMPEP_0196654122 /NCGR_PEP_ID=MMETSP1086-20130531/3805_1 /TAXON_ID=77921 /ORGANISM="Cyanoptyche  gloeocystis , Strain SAG4.97" /LENGTH=569 /DNA_ID=CAMNT_0041985697 /DNA_START=114 /DNA_END=1823 /DNA_ORIENTATION=+
MVNAASTDSVMVVPVNSDGIPQSKKSVGMVSLAVEEKGSVASGNIDPTSMIPKFDLPVDGSFKATAIKLWSIKQPHMRALHLEWIAFFVCFLGWFAIPAMITTIKKDLKLSKDQVVNANTLGVAGTVFARVAMGPVCDKFGPRYGQGALLVLCSFPIFLAGLVQDYSGFLAIRFFISLVGAAFVPTQYHMSFMFSKNVVGSANAIAAGWGNMGGGATQLLMPLLLSAFVAGGYSQHLAWRYAMIIPGLMVFVVGIAVVLFTRDLPLGQYRKLERTGMKEKSGMVKPVKIALADYRTYIFMLQYAVCFGVELTVDSTFAEYYAEEFHLDKVTAGAIASAFGLMNLFSRATGGMISDWVAIRGGMQARLWVMWVGLALEGVFLVIFSRMTNLAASIVFMLIFSYFCQASCGTTFGVVPFLNPAGLGAISGFIGAGGNIGAIATLQLFKAQHYNNAYSILGCIVFGVSFFLSLVRFPELGKASLWSKGDFEKGIGHLALEPSSCRSGTAFLDGSEAALPVSGKDVVSVYAGKDVATVHKGDNFAAEDFVTTKEVQLDGPAGLKQPDVQMHIL